MFVPLAPFPTVLGFVRTKARPSELGRAFERLPALSAKTQTENQTELAVVSVE